MLPARSGVQTKAKAERRSQLSQTLAAPTGNVPAEGLGREPQGALLPGRRRRASGEPSHHIKAPGEGVEAPPSPILSGPREDGGEAERGRAISGLLLGCGCTGGEQLQKGQMFLLSAYTLQTFQVSFSTSRCLSAPNQTVFIMAGDSCLPRKRSKRDERGMTLKAAQARTCRGIPRQCSLRR